MLPEELLAELQKFSARISEDPVRLLAPGSFNETKFSDWRGIGQQVGAFGVSLQLTTVNDDLIDESYFTGGANVEGRIVVEKPRSAACVHFLTARALSDFLEKGIPDDVRTVYTAEQRSNFASLTVEFYPWRGLTADPVAAAGIPTVDPHEYVRDLTTRNVVPNSIAPWIVKTRPLGDDPAVADPAWIDWNGRAARAIAVSLATEIKKDEQDASGIILVFKSERYVTVKLDTITLANYSDEYADVPALLARWVFFEANDITTRHILMSSALAQEWIGGTAWTAGIVQFGRRALDSAKSGYELTLTDTARDGLKGLTDLRKSLYDEVPKTLQQARDLAAGLWRDFAIALAAVLARVALPSQTTPRTMTVYTIGFYAVAGYVLLSGLTNIVINWRFRGIERSSRDEWLRRMYAYLGRSDLSSLAEEPYRKAAGMYNLAASIIAAVYIAMFIALLFVPQVLHSPGVTTSGSLPTPTPKP